MFGPYSFLHFWSYGHFLYFSVLWFLFIWSSGFGLWTRLVGNHMERKHKKQNLDHFNGPVFLVNLGRNKVAKAVQLKQSCNTFEAIWLVRNQNSLLFVSMQRLNWIKFDQKNIFSNWSRCWPRKKFPKNWSKKFTEKWKCVPHFLLNNKQELLKLISETNVRFLRRFG